MLQRALLAALIAAATQVPATVQAQDGTRDNINQLIEEQARANKVPAAFVHRVVKRESNYNPKAKGGSALGLMQIKHATARGMGYSGDAAGLYDPATNLKYGIAYLAGAYRAAQGDLDQAYRYYNRGYYYVAKRLGIVNETAEVDTASPPAATQVAAAQSASGFDGLFGPKAQPASAAANPNQALAYAGGAMPAQAVEVPLPPMRPAALAGGAVYAALEPAAAPQAAPVPSAPAPMPAASAAAAPVVVAAADAVEVPLPPVRPSTMMLAAVAKPAPVALRPRTDMPVLEAAALPAAQ